jgi:hypothetical protein
MQTPKDFAVISSMVIVGSLIGAGCAIKPKRFDDWQVIPNVWGACIGRPSVVLKTPSMKEPMQLLERLQAEYGEKFELDKVSDEFDSLANKAMMDDVKGQLSKVAKGKGKDGVVKGDDLQILKANYMQLAESTEPEATRRLFKTNETSVQSMTLLQVQNERGILVFRDELTGLLVKWDTEQGNDERAYFLEGWNGDGSYTDVKIDGATQSEYDDRPYFRFDDAGQAIFNEWLTALQTVKIQKEENPLMCEHFGKFRSLMPSLALIFHCIDLADGKAMGNVTAKAARLAVDWCKYLESHARRIYAMAESPEHEAAVRLADKIKTKCLPSPFTAKDVYRKHWHGLKEKLEIESACNILIEENWLMMQRKPKPLTGRPPLPEYSINPIFM